MRWALGLLLLASCRAVFGLEPPELVDAQPDTGPSQVSGKLQYRYLENDALGHPQLLITSYAPSDVTMHVTQDGMTTPVSLATDGTFTFMRSPGNYWLEVKTPVRTVTFQSSAPTLDSIDHVYGRFGTTPAGPGTQLKLNFTNRPTTAQEYIASSGVWSLSGLVSTTVDWPNAQFQGPAGLLEASHHDRLYYIGYKVSGATYSVSHAASTEVTLASGQVTQVSLAVAPVAQSSCAHVIAEVATELARVEASVRPGYRAVFGQFSVRSTPALVMSSGTSLVGDNSVADVDANVSYGDPFMMDRYAYLYTIVTRDIGGLGVYEGTLLNVPAGADCNVETRLPAGTVAIPTSFTLAGTALSDGIKVSLPSNGTTELSWTVTSGRADVFLVSIRPSDQVGSISRAYLTTEPHVTLDPGVLARGTSYVFGVQVMRGLPNAGQGDFRNFEQTTGFGNAYSPIFSVE